MASEKILSALSTLHQQLETLEPALEHVKTAQKVTNFMQEITLTVKGIPQKHLDFIEEVIKTDGEFKNGLQSVCEKEISQLSIEHKKLIKNASDLQQNTQKEINQLTAEHQKLIKNAADLQQNAKNEQEDLKKLKDLAESSYNRIEKINFPERLDKLDANVAGIMAAIQSTQSRLDSLERNVIDRLKDNNEFQKEMRNALNISLEQAQKNILSNIEETQKNIAVSLDVNAQKSRSNTYITWALIVISVIALIILK